MQCANCDESLSATLRYACSDCPSEQSPACAACSRALHRPARTRRHRLRLLHPQGDVAARAAVAACRRGGGGGDDDEQAEVALAGRGFCDECLRCAAADPATAAAVPVPLAELECQQCGAASGLCMSCDSVVHRSLERDAHTRQFFDETGGEEAPPQRAHFSLAGQCGLALLHRDAMPSYAGRIWPGSMMLARYCEQMERDEPGCWSGKRIVELGCGCQRDAQHSAAQRRQLDKRAQRILTWTAQMRAFDLDKHSLAPLARLAVAAMRLAALAVFRRCDTLDDLLADGRGVVAVHGHESRWTRHPAGKHRSGATADSAEARSS